MIKVNSNLPDKVFIKQSNLKDHLNLVSGTGTLSTILGSSINGDDFYLNQINQSFVWTCIDCYNNHHNLIIRPDDVWITIIIQFSFYVNHNSEIKHRLIQSDHITHEKRFIIHESSNEMIDYSERELSITINEIKGQLHSMLKDQTLIDFLNTSFTTSTKKDEFVKSCVLLATMKNNFSYMRRTKCGLRNVTLLGEKSDWIKLVKLTERLVEYDILLENGLNPLKMWCSKLIPVLYNFVKSFEYPEDHNVIEWWNNIVHYQNKRSGSSRIDGWITVFCPFKTNGEWQGNSEIKSLPHFTIETDSIPLGFVVVPLTIVNGSGKVTETNIVAGHLSFGLFDEFTIHPKIDWYIFSHIDLTMIEQKRSKKRSRIMKKMLMDNDQLKIV